MNYNIICKLKDKAPVAYNAIKAAIKSHNQIPGFYKIQTSYYIGGVLTGVFSAGIINSGEEDLLRHYFTAYLK